MTTQLLQAITRMVLLIAIGSIQFFISTLFLKWWLFILWLLAALLSFYTAWRCFRLALKIAQAIDEPPVFEVIIEDRATKPGQPSDLPKEETDEEAPENYAHPV